MLPNLTTKQYAQSKSVVDGDTAMWPQVRDPLQGDAPVLSNGLSAWEYQPSHFALALVLRLLRRKAFYSFSKRALDISASLLLLILTTPLFLLVAVLIKLSSPGPVFFKHRRLGLDGKEFWCFKFRTMSADAEEKLRNSPLIRKQFEEKFKLQNDPRVTRIGVILRRTSIDELPQLVQVLRGEMSLIGPRPVVREELYKYGIYKNKLLAVKPGLSGFWQVCGRSNTTYDERVQMDMSYIDNRCLSLDLVIMFLTLQAVLRKNGAC